ncbi:MAG: hypothetical protein IJS81_02245 [Selenomonadaceae bacterium]|nr:hypothetical protein [Selenomonadaceae bacterium]
MRIFLVTLTEVLPFALTKVLNPANDYCAIVVDDPNAAKKNLENVSPLRDKVHPFYELKECIENIDYDAFLFMWDHPGSWSDVLKQIREYGVPTNKFLNINVSPSTKEKHFLLERSLRYYKEHTAEFEMLATGGCYASLGLDNTKFRYKLFNVAKGSQDLYYNYKLAKIILNDAGGGKYIKYALIESAPFIFHYDSSKTSYVCSLLQYCIALNDLHNFWLPVEQFKKLFREEFLNMRLPLEHIDLNNLYYQKSPTLKFMDFNARVNLRKRIDIWEKQKSYPETVKENVQILDDYFTLCEENNVRPIMFLPPLTEAYMRYFNKDKLDEFYYLVSQAQKKHPSAVFFDGWKLEGFSDDYFSDADHMNINYAPKFSAILNQFIESL